MIEITSERLDAAQLLAQTFNEHGLVHKVTAPPSLTAIADTDAFLWCVEKLGPMAWDSHIAYFNQSGAFSTYFHPDRTWGTIFDEYYFRNASDATLFKLFWNREDSNEG